MFFVRRTRSSTPALPVWDCNGIDYVRPVTASSLHAGQFIDAWAGPGKGVQRYGRDFAATFPRHRSEYPSGHSAFSAASAEVEARHGQRHVWYVVYRPGWLVVRRARRGTIRERDAHLGNVRGSGRPGWFVSAVCRATFQGLRPRRAHDGTQDREGRVGEGADLLRWCSAVNPKARAPARGMARQSGDQNGG